MSFVSGIMMGASIGTTIHDMIAGRGGSCGSSGYRNGSAGRVGTGKANTPVEIQPVSVSEFALVSSLAGRRRYRMAALVDNGPLAKLLEQQLARLAIVLEVKANPTTGSLLIEFYPSEENEVAMNNFMEKLRQRLTVVEAEDNPTFKEPTSYAKSWSSTSSFLNKQVRSITGNSFDISALISLVFLIRGIRKCLILGQRPTGPSMIWWALHLMKGWRG